MSAVAKENPSDPGLQIRARLMKATSLLINDAETADKLTEQALTRLDGMEQFMSADAALLVAKQLKMLGQAQASDSMLKNCAEIYGDDPAVMRGIAKQTDDPAILNSGTAAADLNRQGVRSYKAGALTEAREQPPRCPVTATEKHQHRPGTWRRRCCTGPRPTSIRIARGVSQVFEDGRLGCQRATRGIRVIRSCRTRRLSNE